MSFVIHYLLHFILLQKQWPSIPKVPLKPLEDIKNIFQKFKIQRVRPLPIARTSSPRTSKTFVQRISEIRFKLPSFSSQSGSQTFGVQSDQKPSDQVEMDYLHVSSDDSLPFETSSSSDLCYEAESPDEAALVYAARAYRCTLQSRTPDHVTVDLDYLGILKFELLRILPFDSIRKRMSVVVRHPLTEQIVVYTKGADSVIMNLLQEEPTGTVNTCMDKA